MREKCSAVLGFLCPDIFLKMGKAGVTTGEVYWDPDGTEVQGAQSEGPLWASVPTAPRGG